MKIRLTKLTRNLPLVTGLIILVLGGGAGAGYGIYVSQAGSSSANLVGHWKMDGNAKDSTPYANHGTNNGATLTTDRHDKTDGAFHFDGVEDWIDAGDVSEINSDVMSVSTWFYPEDFNQTRQAYAAVANLGGDGSDPDSGYHARDAMYSNTNGTVTVHASSYSCTGGGSSANAALTSGDAAVAGQWNHAVQIMDYTTATVHLYLNGVYQGSETTPDRVCSSNFNYLWIGRRKSASRDNMFGRLDDFRIYNGELTADEVEALHYSYDSRLQVADTQKGLVGHWKFDGNALDSTPYGSNGIINGATLVVDRYENAGRAYSFAGGDFVDMGQPNNLNITSSLSVAAFVNTTQETMGGIVSKWYNTNGNRAYRIFMGSGGELLFDISSDGVETIRCTAFDASLNDGIWHHIVAAYDAAAQTMRIYKNGEQIRLCTTGIPSSIFVSTQNFQVGVADTSLSANSFVGTIDDVRIYNRSIAQEDAEQLYGTYDARIQVSDLQKDLVGNWSFNGNAKDLTPYGNNGTVNGATLTTDRHGKANSAYDFDGTSNSIVISDPPNLQLNSDLTIGAWINTPLNQRSEVVAKHYNYEFSFGVEPDGGLNWWHGDGSWEGVTSRGSGSIMPSVWTHVTAVREMSANTVSFYVNGNLVDTWSFLKNTLSSSSNDIVVGSRGTSQYFEGAIDDVRIWNRALTATEVEKLYQTQ